MVKNEIDGLLDELRALVEGARTVPMSSSVMVNRSEVVELLTELTGAIDRTLVEASQVVADRDSVLTETEAEAEEILRQARRQQEFLVSDTDVYRLAAERAVEVQAEARREVDALRQETDRYIEDKLANFELTLERTLETVRRGRARLTGGHVHGLADDSDVEDIVLPEHLDD